MKANQYPKLISAQVLENYVLLIQFTNQEYRKYDVQPLFQLPMFKPLKNIAFFHNFKIEAGGHALVWSDEIDISAYELWIHGTLFNETEGIPPSIGYPPKMGQVAVKIG